MQMSHYEIFQNYRQAKDPLAQVKILAELNNVTVEEINEILKAQGVDYRKLPRTRKNKAAPKVISQPITPKPEKSIKNHPVDIPKEPSIEDVTFFITKLKQRRKAACEEIAKIDDILKNIAKDCGFIFEENKPSDDGKVNCGEHEPNKYLYLNNEGEN